MKFRPDIEGLRALAVAPVVLFHALPGAFPGGYVGVDVFFVISGYLITGLLMQRLETGRYSIGSFYAARVRRIFPALFCMLVLLLPIACWLLTPASLDSFARSLGATALFVSNIEFYRSAGYFDGASELKPLLHTWSLAVEEQYYIVFPPLLALLYRLRRSAIPPMLLLVGVVSLAYSIWQLRGDASLAFYSAASRTFELMLGSLLAVAAPQLPSRQRTREGLAVLGVAMIVVPWWAYGAQTPFPGLAALPPCLGAVLIIWTGQGTAPPTAIARLVALPVLRWIGALSFSLYLWHWPVLVFLRHALLGEPTVWQAGAAVALSLLLAHLSLRWIETPVRQRRMADRHLLVVGLLCMAFSLLIAWAVGRQAARLEETPGAAETWLQGTRDFNAERGRCHGQQGRAIPYVQRCVFGAPGSTRQAVVWADSHGAELAWVLGERAAQHGYEIAQITASACPPAQQYAPQGRPMCESHNRWTRDALAADSSVDAVILVAHYAMYMKTDPVDFERGLRQSLEALVVAGKQVLLLDPFPTYRYPVPEALSMMERRGLDAGYFGQTVQDYRKENRAALAMLDRLAALPGVTRVPSGDILCGGGHCQIEAEGRPLYFDDNHLSLSGARLLVGPIARRLPALVSAEVP